MLPPITHTLSVETIRDGGSLAATFLGSVGAKTWLFFELETRELPSGQLERLRYRPPVVFDRVAGWPLPATPLSWRHAEVLLHQLRPADERSLAWLETMLAVARSSGEIPPNIERVVNRSPP